MYRSNVGPVVDGIRRGLDAGLTAAAENYTQKVVARLSRGYTTGNYQSDPIETGVVGRVMYTTPYAAEGGRAISMGTSTTRVPYELYWEMGHQNTFTRRYERVEVWRPILEQNADLLFRIIARNVAQYAAGATVTVAFRTPGRS